MTRGHKVIPKFMSRFAAAPVVSAFLLAGCTASDSTAHTEAPIDARSALVSYMPSASQMTVVDELDGIQYTLDTDARTLTRSSDGEVVQLDLRQTAMFASAMHGTVLNDLVVNDLDDGLGSINCELHPEACVDPERAGEDLGFQSTLLRSEPSSASGAKFGIEVKTPVGEFRRLDKSKPRGDGLSTMSGDMCSDVSTVVASRINGYKGMRTQLVKRGLQATVVEFFNGVARKVIPPGSALAVELQDMAASYWNARTDLGILTWVWNSYSCGRHVVAESFIQFREGDFGLFLSCTTEVRWVEIGGTSAPVEVKICQYQSQ